MNGMNSWMSVKFTFTWHLSSAQDVKALYMPCRIQTQSHQRAVPLGICWQMFSANSLRNI